MSLHELYRLLREWQMILRLQDWNITLELVDFLDVLGETTVLSYKDALIRICSEHTIGPDCKSHRKDLEITLCHELEHLHASGFDHLIKEGSAEEQTLELMIDMNAQALVALKRQKNNG